MKKSISPDHRKLFEYAIGRMKRDKIKLTDLNIFKSELVDTIANYYLYNSNSALYEGMESEITSLAANYKISFESLNFLSENFDKIDFFSSEIRKLESIREKSDHDFQLLQKCFLVYLRTDFTWAEVMKMNEIFGLNRNLKKKNKAIMIPNLPKILKECYYGD